MNDVDLLRQSVDQLGPLHLNQVELAAALGVTQPAVSAWLTGRRRMNTEAAGRLHRAWAALEVPTMVIGRDARGRVIEAPAELWEVVFRPTGRFRLPLNLDWSGSPSRRWRDPSDPVDLAWTYATVFDEGRAADVVLWVDPHVLAESWSAIPIARSRRNAWDEHLHRLGLDVGSADALV